MLILSTFDISTDSPETHVVHRPGTDIYCQAITIREGDTIDNYEELTIEEREAREVAAETETIRARKISEAIRARYSLDDELAILRQRDSKPDEFAEYNSFVEAIKAELLLAE